MRNIKLKPMVNDVFYNQFINNIGLHLENKSIADPTMAIFVEYTKYLRKTLTLEQMSIFQNAFNIPINEMGGMSDDEIAKAIAGAAKELEGDYPDAKYLENPEKLDIGALFKGDIEQGLGLDGSETEEKPDTQTEDLLREIHWTAALAVPSILKLISKIIEWVKRQMTDNTELRLIKVMEFVYKSAKKGVLLDRKGLWTMANKESGIMGSKLSAQYALMPNMEEAFNKDLDIVFKRIYDSLEDKKKKDKHLEHSKFSATGDKPQKIDKHLLHLIDGLTYTSEGAKNIAAIGHKIHDVFLIPLKAVITSVMAMKYGVLKKSSWKRAWEESESIANKFYIGIMFVYLGYEGFHALMASSGNIATTLKSAFGSVEKLADLTRNTIKAGDMAAVGAEDILALAGASGDIAGG